MAFSFDDTIKKLIDTGRGREASMYGPIRDLFIQVLKYPAADVDIDTTGEGGRPDITARAPSGLRDAKNKPSRIDWIVVEAKDERGCFRDAASREKIFAVKSKYIGTNTAWFLMVEPEAIIARQVTGKDFATTNDIELPLHGLTRQEFDQRLALLKHDVAGVPYQLEQFRKGNTSLIASEKLDKPDPTTSSIRIQNRYRVTRRRFFDSVREVTAYLQSATRNALEKQWPQIEQYRTLANNFGEKYKERGRDKDKWEFNPYTLTIKAKPQGPDATRQHQKDAIVLRQEFKKNPAVARLALDDLPNFQARTGAKDEDLAELFSIESANLILARILLLRFFEDNGFFGPVKYVCNGGVEAFQKMRTYFQLSYTRLLEEAYRKASSLYAAAFDETEMDWVLGINDQGLSASIEWAMYQLSRYDFTTIKGDILTGIYDRFMDRAQRKKLGEFYTPPSIARYIIKRCGVTRESRVLDPACGSGTFLIEAYRTMIGNDIDRGAAEYADAQDALTRIAGNDLNTFSSVLAQIQLLWQVLGMREAIELRGFPDIHVTGKVNSLVKLDQQASLERFGELDNPVYDAVIGNPPYVRSERSAQELDKVTIDEFEHGRNGYGGISAKKNAYTLFIYRALSSWCKPQAEDGSVGKLGFIIPVSLFDANETDDLRRLFKIGGRWTIREIIDMEVIWKKVFDAKALPAIIIIENRPATIDDTVSIRLASQDCVKLDQGEALPKFDLEGLSEQHIHYSDLFTPDGRIMTRLTPTRLAVISKLWDCGGTLRDAAKVYWRGTSRAAKGKYTDKRPEPSAAWQERKMIAGGIAFRKEQKHYKTDGHLVYKGENIISAELQGDPVEQGIDLDFVSDNSLWSVGSILPLRGYAVAQVAHCVNAVGFDPKKIAFTNTASLFFPKDELSSFPFDLLFISNTYIFFYAIASRMGALDTLRSHIYPTNMALIPWSDTLATKTTEIEALRQPIINACHRRFQAREALREALTALSLQTLKHHMRHDTTTRLTWSDAFDSSSYEVEISRPRLGTRAADEIQIFLADNLLDWLEITRYDLAEGLRVALLQREGEALSKSTILNMPIPVTETERQVWDAAIAEHQEERLTAEMDARLEELDSIVGLCLGLEATDTAFIKQELRDDPFLKGIRPRYPGTVTRKQGFRTGLDSSERYQ
jgi:SAM-dependent methyltransferase